MTSEATIKNISEDDEKSFSINIATYLDDIENTNKGKKYKILILIKIFTILNTMTFWINNHKYKKFKPIVITKAYSLLEEINYRSAIIDQHTLQTARDSIDKTLLLCMCNKKVKGKYCKNKKVGSYCTFHTNKKKEILDYIKDATKSYIINDITTIIDEYISL